MKKNIIFISVFLTMISGYGQESRNANGLELSRMHFQAKQVIGPSPEAAELGKYGNVPVSLFTGTPQLSIPLFELKGKTLSLPVSFSYNSGGFKPGEIAPWTGLGWALNAGGVITRAAQGDPDVDANYFSNSSAIRPAPTDELEKQNYFDSIRMKTVETQADIYYYNFMGHSGKFFLYPNGSVLQKEKGLLKITNSGDVFTVIDENGVRYVFEKREYTTIAPYVYFDPEPGGTPPATPISFTSAWYLTRVMAPYGNEQLLLEYFTPSGGQVTWGGTLANQSVTYSRTQTPYNLFWQSDIPSNSAQVLQPPAIGIQKQFLSKITLFNGSIAMEYIEFESDSNSREDLDDAAFSGERLLKKIKLFESGGGSNILLKQYELGFEYFGAAQTELSGYRRLMLKTIGELSPDSTVQPHKPPYVFEYEGESSAMPPRFSSGLDHWGFYNGKESYNIFGGIPTLIPTVLTSANYLYGNRGLGADRSADFSSGVLTVLNKIKYPTGGYTSFEYEGNQYDQSSVAKASGGVRIKKITDYSFDDVPAETKIYTYTNTDNTSSGSPSPEPVYDVPSEFYYVFHPFYLPPGVDPETVDPNYYRYSVTIKASSVISLGSMQGSHIGYARVTESKIKPGSSDTLGKTVYEYNISGFTEVDEHLGNGDLLRQSTYDDAGHLLEEVTNTFVYADPDSGVYSLQLLPATIQSSETRLYKNATTGAYLYIDDGAGTAVPSGYVGVRDVFTQYILIQNTLRQQSKKMTVQTRKAYDVSNGLYITTTKNITYGNADYLYPTLTEERNSLNEKVYTAIKHAGDYAIGCSPASGSSGELIKQMQDSNMVSVPVEMLVYKKDSTGSNRRYIGGRYVESVLGQPQKLYLLKVKPVLDSVLASGASCTLTPAIDSHYSIEALMSYDDQSNLIEETKVNDVMTTYIWDYQGRYPVSKVTNASYASVSYAGFEADGMSNWDYSSVGVKTDSGAVTGHKAFVLASGRHLQRTALDASATYILTYWLKTNGASIYVDKGSASGGTSGTVLMDKNGWKLYQKEIKMQGDSVLTITGTGVIDEVRLFPKTAQMMTYTLDPQIGITSQCDANNRIIYYEYDLYNRLLRIRDIDKNILKSFSYIYQETQ
jgi:hypothetical protein